MSASAAKRQNGQFFTRNNPFRHSAFLGWAEQCNLAAATVLEPFAGSNSLIDHLADMELLHRAVSYDIAPADIRVSERDSLADFPEGFSHCVTNPPWLAKNSATARGLPFPDCSYDDIYKYALEKCLARCEWVAALVPESFIRQNLFRERLSVFVSLTSQMFSDTEHPTGLALFQPENSTDTDIWSGQHEIGKLSDMEAMRPAFRGDRDAVRFNAHGGNAGLIAVDNTTEASIRFCDIEELSGYPVKPTGRYITHLKVSAPIRIDAWNELLGDFRDRTCDVLMTSYRGLRKDGKYRRRLDWDLARGIISQTYSSG